MLKKYFVKIVSILIAAVLIISVPLDAAATTISTVSGGDAAADITVSDGDAAADITVSGGEAEEDTTVSGGEAKEDTTVSGGEAKEDTTVSDGDAAADITVSDGDAAEDIIVSDGDGLHNDDVESDLLPAAVFTISPTAAATSTAAEMTQMGLSVGKGLIDASVSGEDAFPDREADGWAQNDSEWSYGMPKSGWSWWRGTADDLTYSASFAGEDTITASAYQTDNVILLPELPSTNYKFEATFTVQGDTDPEGSFGLITNIAPAYTDSIGGTMFVAYAAGHNSGKKNRVYTRNKCSKANGQQSANTYVPTEYTAPGAGDSVTLTVYAYNGTNYYYINGAYVSSLASIFTTEGESLCGFFCSGNTETAVTITNISVRELAPTSEIPSEVAALGLSVGGELIDTEISSRYDIPHHEESDWAQNAEEWSYGMPKSGWGWWRDDNGTYSASVSAYNELSQSANATDSIILLPKLPSANYKFEATFTVAGDTDPNGSFGLITNIGPAYTDSIGGTMFVAYAAGHNSGKKNRIYTRNKAKKANIGEALYEGSNTNYVPEGYTAPGAGDSATLTVYAYEGRNHYYINGIYVASVDSKLTTAGESLCGFFCSGNGETTVTITDFSVRELILNDTSGEEDDTGTGDEMPEGLEFDGSYTIGSVIYETDFENEEQAGLPEGWQAGNKADGTSKFGWADANASMTAEVVALEGYGNVLHFGSVRTDAYLTTPDTGTLDYIFEANVIVNYATEGEFGLANNFYAGVNDADGCMYNSSHIVPANVPKKESTWKYRTSNGSTKGTWAVSYYPKNGDTANLKILSYKGYNYMYWNDILCAIAQARGVSGDGVAVSDNPGFFTYGGDIYITDVKITAIHYDKAELVVDRVALSVAEDGKVGIDMNLSFDKTQDIYTKYVTGDYAYSDDADLKFGVVMAVGNSQVPQEIEVGTEGTADTVFTACTQDSSKLSFMYSVPEVPEENFDKFYTIRPYCLAAGTYLYGEAKAYSAAGLANGIYAFTEDAALKNSLDTIFADSDIFAGKEAASLTFTLFADFHYKAGMYSVSIADLESILKRADESNSAFIMSAGDLFNDAKGSPELFQTYLNYRTKDGKLLAAYNIYGNHELEGTGNSMEIVTPTLTNAEVVWGTEDGKMDTSIGYYYFESNGFRIVCIDTQHSYNPATGAWEHNPTKSYGAPSGNTNVNSLGPVQLAWLEKVLMDAADKDIPCIVVGHDGFSGLGWATSSSDASAVRDIYKRVNDINPGTVLMSINGHKHTNHQGYSEGVFYLDTNTVRNGYWQSGGTAHYTEEHTYAYQEYDEKGNPVGDVVQKPLSELSQADNTWFFADPLSAVVTINEYGVITINGAQSTWAYGVEPQVGTNSGVEPQISSGTYWSCDLLGHSFVWQSDDTQHWAAECSNTLCNTAVEKSDHVYGEWEVVNEATTTETGLKERACTVCGKTQTEELPVISDEEDDTSGDNAGDDSDNTGGNAGGEGTGSEDGGSTDGNGSDSSGSEENGGEGSDTSGTQNSGETDGNVSGEETAASNAPATGDAANPVLWLILILLSGIVLLLVGGRKNLKRLLIGARHGKR